MCGLPSGKCTARCATRMRQLALPGRTAWHILTLLPQTVPWYNALFRRNESVFFSCGQDPVLLDSDGGEVGGGNPCRYTTWLLFWVFLGGAGSVLGMVVLTTFCLGRCCTMGKRCGEPCCGPGCGGQTPTCEYSKVAIVANSLTLCLLLLIMAAVSVFGLFASLHVADDLIGEVLSMHGRRGVRAVSACIVANLKATGVNLSAPSCPPSSWRMQEACLNVLTRVAQGLLIEAKRDASGDDAGKGGKGKKKKKKKPLPLTVESVLPYLTTCVSAMPHIATACQAAQAAGTSTDTILGMSFVLGRALSAAAGPDSQPAGEQQQPSNHAAQRSSRHRVYVLLGDQGLHG